MATLISRQIQIRPTTLAQLCYFMYLVFFGSTSLLAETLVTAKPNESAPYSVKELAFCEKVIGADIACSGSCSTTNSVNGDLTVGSSGCNVKIGGGKSNTNGTSWSCNSAQKTALLELCVQCLRAKFDSPGATNGCSSHPKGDKGPGFPGQVGTSNKSGCFRCFWGPNPLKCGSWDVCWDDTKTPW